MTQVERPLLKVRVLAWLSWGWLAAAVPFITDASTPFLIGIGLAGSWLLLEVCWLMVPFVPPGLRYRSDWQWWLAAGTAGALGYLLAVTNVGLMARIAMCESSLSS